MPDVYVSDKAMRLIEEERRGLATELRGASVSDAVVQAILELRRLRRLELEVVAQAKAGRPWAGQYPED